MKKILPYLVVFLLGSLSASLYYRLSIWPQQFEYLSKTYKNESWLYFGDWVLDIFFPAIPLIIILSTIWVGLFFKEKLSSK